MKKLTILLSALCIPAVAWAHGGEVLVASLIATPILALIISFIMLPKLNKYIDIHNKFLRVIFLVIMEIILIVLLLFITFFIFLIIYSMGYLRI